MKQNDVVVHTMTSYYHRKFTRNERCLMKLDGVLLSKVFSYISNKELSYVDPLGLTIPIVSNVIIHNSAFSVDGVSTLLDPDDSRLVFPGTFVDELESIFPLTLEAI